MVWMIIGEGKFLRKLLSKEYEDIHKLIWKNNLLEKGDNGMNMQACILTPTFKNSGEQSDM